MRRQIVLFGTVVALLAMALPGSALAHLPRGGTCSGGTMLAGTYSGFTVTGTCTIDAGAAVQINGNLIVARGASLDDHGAEAWQGAQMHITGNVIVGKGAVLGLGYNSAEGTLGPDTVSGNIVADQPLALQVGNLTVGGNLISIGGDGSGGASPATDARNFPIKDNVIHGSLILHGWRGGWLGVIRNHVDGNVIVSHNMSLSTPPGPGGTPPGAIGMDPDSTEVQTNTISGNLICFGNSPPAQVNSADGGAANVVGGNAIGECAGLKA
jgi:hypothetical protein